MVQQYFSSILPANSFYCILFLGLFSAALLIYILYNNHHEITQINTFLIATAPILALFLIQQFISIIELESLYHSTNDSNTLIDGISLNSRRFYSHRGFYVALFTSLFYFILYKAKLIIHRAVQLEKERNSLRTKVEQLEIQFHQHQK
jgi:energy-coupling factor transporter transmembrane protein EcfT